MRKMLNLIGIAVVAVTVLALTQTFSAQAATAAKLRVGCSRTTAMGRVEAPAPYVRATVTLASDLTQTIATKVVPVRRNGLYKVSLSYPRQEKGTRLIVSVGEWDGTQYVQPATLVGADCKGR